MLRECIDCESRDVKVSCMVDVPEKDVVEVTITCLTCGMVHKVICEPQGYITYRSDGELVDYSLGW